MVNKFHRITLVILLLILINTGFIYAQDIKSGLVIDYDFDELSFIDGDPYIMDMSGNNLNGSLKGSPYITSGRLAFHSAGEDLVALPASPLIFNNRDATFVVKVRYLDLPGSSVHTLFSARTTSAFPNDAFTTLFTTNYYNYRSFSNGIDDSPPLGVSAHMDETYQSGMEYLLVYTIDSSTNTFSTYLNGRLLKTNNLQTGFTTANFLAIVIGQRQVQEAYKYYPAHKFRGYMEKFMLFNRLLSEQDILELQRTIYGANVLIIEGRLSEGGQSELYSVRLDKAPTENVTLSISTEDTDEAILSTDILNFTPLDWNIPKYFTLTGVDDLESDGDQTVTVTIDYSQSIDANYKFQEDTIIKSINVDNEGLGFEVRRLSGDTVEGQPSANYSVRLLTPPTGNVNVEGEVFNVSEASISPNNFLFTPKDWNSPQTFSINPVDDTLEDGSVTNFLGLYVTSTEDTTGYANIVKDLPFRFTFSVKDNDTAGILFSSPVLNIDEGDTAQLAASLTLPPEQDVIVQITSSNPDRVSLSTETLTFTPLNWSSPQILNVTSPDNLTADLSKPILISYSIDPLSDPEYNVLPPFSAIVNIVDDEVAGFTISHQSTEGDNSPEGTTEGGDTQEVLVNLNTKPIGNVIVDITSSPEGEIYLSHNILTFTPENYLSPQTIVATGVDDEFADGDQVVTLTFSSNVDTEDPVYLRNAIDSITLSNLDNDSPAINLSSIMGSPSEQIESAKVNLTLASKPYSNVTIYASAFPEDEVDLSPSIISFTPDNFSSDHLLNIFGKDDNIADGNVPVTISFNVVSNDLGYADYNLSPITVYNIDDESPGLVLSNFSGVLSEAGDQINFGVNLTSQPLSNVTVNISANPEDEVTSFADLTFTPSDFAGVKMVTLAGVDDDITDGNVEVTIQISVSSTSADPVYAASGSIKTLKYFNYDNETAGIIKSTVSGIVSEDLEQGTFKLTLLKEPSETVSITLTSSDPGELAISPESVTFNSTDWSSAKSITLTGINDDFADGDISAQVVFYVSSADSQYDSFAVTPLNVVNKDNDSAGYNISKNSLTVSEGGDMDSFSLSLQSAPTNDFSLSLSSTSDEVLISPSVVNFSDANWDSVQTITVKGLDDSKRDGDVVFSIEMVPINPPQEYEELGNIISISGLNIDNERAGVILRQADGNIINPAIPLITREDGSEATFNVSLKSAPIEDVTINLSISNEDEGLLLVRKLTFNADNWSSLYPVKISGLDDNIDDGDIQYSLTMSIETNDSFYSNVSEVGTLPTLSLTNIDNDSAGYILIPLITETYENITGVNVFSLALNTKPSGNVDVSFSISDSLFATLSQSQVTFDESNWNNPVKIAIDPIDDFVPSGNRNLIISFQTSSDDLNYQSNNLAPPPNLSILLKDDDIPGIYAALSNNFVSEAGQTSNLSIRLNTKPTNDVALALSVSDSSEILPITEGVVTFTTNDWNTEKVFTVSGIDDDILDGTERVFVEISVAGTSDSTGYGSLPNKRIHFFSLDNDQAPPPKPVILSPALDEIIYPTDVQVKIRTFMSEISDITYNMYICEIGDIPPDCKMMPVNDGYKSLLIVADEEDRGNLWVSLFLLPLAFLFRNKYKKIILFSFIPMIMLTGCLKQSRTQGYANVPSSGQNIVIAKQNLDISPLGLTPGDYELFAEADKLGVSVLSDPVSVKVPEN